MNVSLLLMCGAATVTPGQPMDVFKAPLIQVKEERRDEKELRYLLYNRVYVGRNYLKPKDDKDRGNPAVDFSRLPTTYFHDQSPIGVVMQKYNWFPGKENTFHADARLPASVIAMAGLDPYFQLGQAVQLWSEPPIAVLGMDVGTLAAYARPAQTMHFTERVPTFVKLSFPDKGKDRYFHYVQDALDRGANLKVFEGEPREMIEKHGGAGFYHVIVVETYKMPVIGVHKELLTKEGLQMLMSKVRDDGIVCIHTSSRFYEMAPIIGAACNELKLACVVGKDMGQYHLTPATDHRYSSEWVMVARSEKHLAHLKAPPAYEELMKAQKFPLPDPYWSPPKRMDKKFLWTDKGEQSFRGLYYSDPQVDKLYDLVHDVEDVLRDTVGSGQWTYRVSESVRSGIRTWSKWSADRLNREAPKSKAAPKSEDPPKR